MRTMQTVLLAAIFAALSIIAGELHSIRVAMTPGAALSAGVLKMLTPAAETRAQRDARLQRETRRAIDDAVAIGNTPDAPPRQPTRK